MGKRSRQKEFGFHILDELYKLRSELVAVSSSEGETQEDFSSVIYKFDSFLSSLREDDRFDEDVLC